MPSDPAWQRHTPPECWACTHTAPPPAHPSGPAFVACRSYAAGMCTHRATITCAYRPDHGRGADYGTVLPYTRRGAAWRKQGGGVCGARYQYACRNPADTSTPLNCQKGSRGIAWTCEPQCLMSITAQKSHLPGPLATGATTGLEAHHDGVYSPLRLWRAMGLSGLGASLVRHWG